MPEALEDTRRSSVMNDDSAGQEFLDQEVQISKVEDNGYIVVNPVSESNPFYHVLKALEDVRRFSEMNDQSEPAFQRFLCQELGISYVEDDDDGSNPFNRTFSLLKALEEARRISNSSKIDKEKMSIDNVETLQSRASN
uniref:Uncharacterized protein n=1 Tax=Panagrolaimus sp. JU765 TaxID=591449 RepID=A0AC34QPI0_9BILA